MTTPLGTRHAHVPAPEDQAGLDAELLGVLGVESLPAFEFHGLGANDTSKRLAREKPIQHVQAEVPTGGAHRNVSTVDVVPEREPRTTASQRLQLPADVLSAPIEFEHFERVGSFHLGLGYQRRRCSHRRELCVAHGTEVAVGIEGRPFAEVLGLRERLPNLRRRMGQVTDENERPRLSSFSDLGAGRGAGRVVVMVVHRFLPFRLGTGSMRSRWRSRASTWRVQKRRKGASHASISMSGSGRIR